MDDIDIDEFEEEDFELDNEYDATASINQQLDPKSQWLSTLFAHDVDIRATADKWGIRKHIWHRFWDRLMQTPEYSSAVGRKGRSIRVFDVSGSDLDPHGHYMDWETRTHHIIGAAPPFLRAFRGTMWERHVENIAIARAVTEETYRGACEDVNPATNDGHAQVKALHTLTVKRIAGVDVYWDGEVEDTPTEKDQNGLFYRKLRRSKSETNFGTLRVWPFPFTALFRYDDVEEHALFSMAPVIHGVRRIPHDGREQLERFVQLNVSQAIQVQKELRLKIRSMDAQTCTVYVGKKDEKKRQIEGQLFMKPKEPDKNAADLWKNKSTNEIVSTAPGFHFEIKTTPQAVNEEKCLAFVCGNPETGVHPDHYLELKKENSDDEIDEFDTGPRALALPSLGMEEHFNPEDPGLHELTTPDNIDTIFLDYVKKLYQSYRDHLWTDAAFKEKVLSREFWLYVYNNDRISKDQLKKTLEQYERKDNMLIRDLFNDGVHVDKIDDLYKRMESFEASIVVTCWYMFWHAIELHNRARTARKRPMYSKDVQQILDPAEPGSLNAQKLHRNDLVRVLMANEVWKPDNSGCVSDELLDALYQKMEELHAQTSVKLTNNWKRRVFTTKDPGGKGKRLESGLEDPNQSLSRQNTDMSGDITTTAEHSSRQQAKSSADHDDDTAGNPLLAITDKEFRDNGPCARACNGGECALM